MKLCSRVLDVARPDPWVARGKCNGHWEQKTQSQLRGRTSLQIWKLVHTPEIP